MLPASSSGICTLNSSSSASTRFIWRSESQFGIVSMLASGPMSATSTLSIVAITCFSASSFNISHLYPGGCGGGEIGRAYGVSSHTFGRFGQQRQAETVIKIGHLRVLRAWHEFGTQLGAAARHGVGHDARPDAGLHAAADDTAAHQK